MTAAAAPPAARRGQWDERSLLPSYTGARWWLAVALALALSSVGAFIDLQRLDRLGGAFYVCYLLGCVLAVIVVQRKGLFGPMVQPPLVLAGTVPVMVLLTGGASVGGGTAATALAIGTPLINNFPVMAITTVLTLALGGLRLANERPPAPALPLLAQLSEEPADPRPPGPEAAPRTRSYQVERDPVHGADAEPITEPVPRVQHPPPARRPARDGDHPAPQGPQARKRSFRRRA